MNKDPLGGLPVKAFTNQKKWEAWLAKNHTKTGGVWVRMFKKDTGRPTVTYKEAVEEALCYGWIDGLMRSMDSESYIQKFTPRRAKSVWSKINTANAERLIKAGKMKPAGLKQIEAAKSDGRWARAYHPPSTAEMPHDFLKLVNKHKKAKDFLATLNKSNKFAIIYQLNSAKKVETRERRMQKFLGMLSKGHKLY